MKQILVNGVTFANDQNFSLIAGPCAMESRDHAMFMCEQLKEICDRRGVQFVFKTSFDKANRTSIDGKRGIGIDAAKKVFEELKSTFQVPVITDVHTAEQCNEIKSSVDMLQIPALLCRQTDLLEAAAKTNLPVNIKKGQFLAPWDMKNVVKKFEAFNNTQILLCERGASFGYNTLVSDMRSLAVMAETKYPVIFDATHSVQQPGGQGTKTGGQREMAPILARAALAVGIAGVFAEVHNDPDNAFSDGPNMIRLDEFENVLKEWVAIDQASKQHPRFL